MNTQQPARCPWALASPAETRYHDHEWGVPVYDDATHYAFLVLETAQAGLSWRTILQRREGYRAAFAGFDPVRVSQFTQQDVDRLLQDTGIIRNRLKILSAISNAACFLKVQAEYGSFSRYIWNFVEGRTVQNAWKRKEDVPASTPLSDVLAKDMKQRGFRFVGSTIMYAYLQATGLVNDHLVSCFRYEIIRAMGEQQ